MQKQQYFFVLILALIVFLIGCSVYINDSFRQQYRDQNEILHADTTQTDYYKLHFKDGDVALMSQWDNNASEDSIKGTGILYDFDRKLKRKGTLAFHIDDIAIGETNDLTLFENKDKQRREGLQILIAFNLIVNINCIISPKFCFGSCPTFYVEGNSDLTACNAEGFSHSISPSMASTDIDALQYSSSGENFELTLKNEALETHVIDEIRLIAVPKSIENAVFQSGAQFLECTPPMSPVEAMAEEVDIIDLVSEIDNQEYFAPTDSLDLFAPEELLITFNPIEKGGKGLVLNFRQTLTTTFLFYNALSLLGDEVSDYMALYENSDQMNTSLFKPMLQKSKIKIEAWNEAKKRWEFISDIFEIGPIAKNKILIQLPDLFDTADVVKIRLSMPKGNWRIDYVGITNIIEKVKPLEIPPYTFSLNGLYEGRSLTSITSIDGDRLTTLPGDEGILKFELPCISLGIDYELFVKATGYYLEWMRKEWLKDKDVPGFKKMITLDKAYWKKLAIQFKEQESEAEEIFWNSNIDVVL